MDLLTAFVTIVELLSIFSQEPDSSKTKEQLDFLRWLENHNHQELKELICTNQQLSREVSKLLAEDTVTILNHVSETNRILGSILAHIDFFSGLSTSLATPHLLSSQALEILANFYASSALAMMHIETWRLHFEGTNNGLILDEPVYLQDDLNTLVLSGLLREEFVGGIACYQKTRIGATFVKHSRRDSRAIPPMA